MGERPFHCALGPLPKRSTWCLYIEVGHRSRGRKNSMRLLLFLPGWPQGEAGFPAEQSVAAVNAACIIMA
ncbi:uncharacterized protein LOC144179109 isoform X2 [Haemaphysalis longicornis]